MTNSRAKGAAGERELAHELTLRGLLSRRTVQYSGKGEDSADLMVEGLHLHVEVKRCEQIRLTEWLEQVERDSKGKPWVIFYRRSRGPWLVIMSLSLWVDDSQAAGRSRALQRARIDAVVAEAARDGF